MFWLVTRQMAVFTSFPGLSYCSPKETDVRAVIQVALHGTSWAEASHDTFGLLRRSAHLTAFTIDMNHSMLTVVKLLVVSVSGTVCFCTLHNLPNIYNPTGPTIIVCLVAWAVAGIYADIYEVTINTIMMCFSEDRERHDGSFMKQYFMTAGLKQLLLEDLAAQNHADELLDDEDSSSSDTEPEQDGDQALLVGIDLEAKREQEEFDLYARG